jgi:RecA-family ATPase
MITLMRCKITSEGETVNEWEGATIVASGESPNSTVAISAPDQVSKKFRRVDRVLNASVKGHGRDWIIEGTSEQLIDEVGVPVAEARVRYQIIAAGGCQGCP